MKRLLTSSLLILHAHSCFKQQPKSADQRLKQKNEEIRQKVANLKNATNKLNDSWQELRSILPKKALNTSSADKNHVYEEVYAKPWDNSTSPEPIYATPYQKTSNQKRQDGADHQSTGPELPKRNPQQEPTVNSIDLNGTPDEVHYYSMVANDQEDEATNNKYRTQYAYVNDTECWGQEGNKEPIYEEIDEGSTQYSSVGDANSSIGNVRPTPKKEAIAPLQLVTPDLKKCAINVHTHIPQIKNFNLDQRVTQGQNIINAIIEMRKKDNDDQLTEAQKQKLREIKFLLKKEYEPFWEVIQFYSRVNEQINSSPNSAQTLDKEYVNVCVKNAEKINKRLPNTIKKINSLIDLMKIQPEN